MTYDDCNMEGCTTSVEVNNAKEIGVFGNKLCVYVLNMLPHTKCFVMNKISGLGFRYTVFDLIMIHPIQHESN
jgi:hypothetical protein